MIFPNSAVEPLICISPFSCFESIGLPFYNYAGTSNGALNGISGGTFPASNRALYFPFSITKSVLIAAFFAANGATVSGNIDLGVYDSNGTKIVSTGSVAQTGTTTLQLFTITGTMLAPGQYYLAVAMDNTTGILIKGQSAQAILLQTLGCAQQATAFPLPATATFASMATDFMPLIGLTTNALI